MTDIDSIIDGLLQIIEMLAEENQQLKDQLKNKEEVENV